MLELSRTSDLGQQASRDLCEEVMVDAHKEAPAIASLAILMCCGESYAQDWVGYDTGKTAYSRM